MTFAESQPSQVEHPSAQAGRHPSRCCIRALAKTYTATETFREGDGFIIMDLFRHSHHASNNPCDAVRPLSCVTCVEDNTMQPEINSVFHQIGEILHPDETEVAVLVFETQTTCIAMSTGVQYGRRVIPSACDMSVTLQLIPCSRKMLPCGVGGRFSAWSF
jgi:hypothetical protein